MPVPPAAHLSGPRENLVRVAHERLRVWQESLAKRRQLGAVPPPFEQLAAETRHRAFPAGAGSRRRSLPHFARFNSTV